MSYFTEEGNQPQNQQVEDFVAEVVKQKGDQWADPQVLAKGYATSQEYIAKLETELKAKEAEANKADYMKEILDAVKAKQAPSTGEQPSTNISGNGKGDDQPQVSVEQIKELVQATLTETEANRTAQQNLQETDRKLTEMFGTNVKEVLAQKEKELGMNKEKLMSLAQESPTAFFTLIGKPPAKETNTNTTSSVNTAGSFNQSSERNFAYYNKMRKEDPKLYRTADIQRQMLEDRLKLGDRFY